MVRMSPNITRDMRTSHHHTSTTAAGVRKRVYAPKAKHWVYTLNNPMADELLDDSLATYHVYGREKGESGTPHLQGYVAFKKGQRFTSVKKILPRAYWAKMKGTSQEASDYCKKDGDYHEYGTLPLTGPQQVKVNYDQLWVDIKTKSIEDLPKQYLCNHYKTVVAIKKDYPIRPADLPDVCGIWIYGKSGVGKSRLAREMASNVYYPKKADKWWDGYQQEDYVILDDLSPKHCDMAYNLKLWADYTSFIAETKGGSMLIRPKHFIVTSQYTIGDVFRDSPLDCEAVERRFKMIYKDKDFK